MQAGVLGNSSGGLRKVGARHMQGFRDHKIRISFIGPYYATVSCAGVKAKILEPKP